MDTSNLFITPRYSNPRLFSALRSWKGWVQLGEAIKIKSFNFTSFYWSLFRGLLSYFVELIAFSGRVILRVKHGRHCLGSALYFSTFLLLAFLNSKSLWAAIDKFKVMSLSLWKIVAGLELSWESLGELFWQQSSAYFDFYLLIFFIVGGIQLLVRYSHGYMNTDTPFRKGTSWVYLLFKQRTQNVSAQLIEGYFEPSLFVVSGWLMYMITQEVRFPGFLILTGICIFWQELMDRNHRKAH